MSREKASYSPRHISLAGCMDGDGMHLPVPQHIPVDKWLSFGSEGLHTSIDEHVRKLTYPHLESMNCASSRQSQMLVHPQQCSKEIENTPFILSRHAQTVLEHPQNLTMDTKNPPSIPSRHAAVVIPPQHLTEDIKKISFNPMRRTQVEAHPQCLTDNIHRSSSTQSRPEHVFLRPQRLTEVIQQSPSSPSRYAGEFLLPQCLTENIDSLPYTSTRRAGILAHPQHLTKDVDNPTFAPSRHPDVSAYPHLTKDIENPPSTPSRCPDDSAHSRSRKGMEAPSSIHSRRAHVLAHPQCCTDIVERATSTPNRCTYLLVRSEDLPGHIQRAHSSPERCVALPVKDLPFCSDDRMRDLTSPSILKTISCSMGDREKTRSTPTRHIYTPESPPSCSGDRERTRTSSKKILQSMDSVEDSQALSQSYKESNASYTSESQALPQSYKYPDASYTSELQALSQSYKDPDASYMSESQALSQSYKYPDASYTSELQALPQSYKESDASYTSELQALPQSYKDPNDSYMSESQVWPQSYKNPDASYTSESQAWPQSYKDPDASYTSESQAWPQSYKDPDATYTSESQAWPQSYKDPDASYTSESQVWPQSYKDLDVSYTSESQVPIQLVPEEIATENICGDKKNDISDQNLRNLLIHIPENELSLTDFIQLCGPYTNDKAQFLTQVMDEELNTFYDLTKMMYEKKFCDMEDILAAQQLSLRNRYKQWIVLMDRRKCSVLDALNKLVLHFDWDKYMNDKFYLRNYFILQKANQIEFQDVSQEEVQEECCHKTMHCIQFVEEELSQIQEEGEVLSNTLKEMRENKLDHMAQQEDIMCYMSFKGKKLKNKLRQLRLEYKQLKDEFKIAWLQQKSAVKLENIEHQ